MYEHVLTLRTLDDTSLALAGQAPQAEHWAAMAVALACRHRCASTRTLFEDRWLDLRRAAVRPAPGRARPVGCAAPLVGDRPGHRLGRSAPFKL